MDEIGEQASIRFGGIRPTTTRSDWLTPPDLKAKIYARWKLDFDPCPYPRPPGFDGLRIPWNGRAFVNPPYGKDTSQWLAKGLGEVMAARCPIAVYLIHSRTDTHAFHRHVLPFPQELYFIQGRVAFHLPGTPKPVPAPFPSLIAVFYLDVAKPPTFATWV